LKWFVAAAPFFLFRSRLAVEQLIAFSQERYRDLALQACLSFPLACLPLPATHRLFLMALVPALSCGALFASSKKHAPVEVREGFSEFTAWVDDFVHSPWPKRWIALRFARDLPAAQTRAALRRFLYDVEAEGCAAWRSEHVAYIREVSLNSIFPSRFERIALAGGTIESISSSDDMAGLDANQSLFHALRSSLRMELERVSCETPKLDSYFAQSFPDGFWYDVERGELSGDLRLNRDERMQIYTAFNARSQAMSRSSGLEKFETAFEFDEGALRRIYFIPKSAPSTDKDKWRNLVRRVELRKLIARTGIVSKADQRLEFPFVSKLAVRDGSKRARCSMSAQSRGDLASDPVVELREL
jgi:hypothetical protein